MTMVYDIRSTGFNHFFSCLLFQPFYGFAFLSVRVILLQQNCTENGKKVVEI